MKGKWLLCVLLVVVIQLALNSAMARAQSPYDVNGDGSVDILDIQTWALSFGTFEGEDGFNPAVDVHSDGVIDIFDAMLISLNFG